MTEIPIMPVLIIVALVVGLGAFLLYSRAQEKRREQYRAFAAQQGWGYAEEDAAYVDRWEGKPFDSGHGRKAVNVVVGTHQGWSVAAFEHRHQTTSSNGQSTSTSNHWHTVWVLRLPQRMPRVEIKPWGVIRGKIAEWFGMQDVKCGDEAFDERFRVQAADERFAIALLQPSVTRLLLDGGLPQVRIDGDELIVWESGRTEPQHLTTRFDLMVQLVGMIPASVWKAYES